MEVGEGDLGEGLGGGGEKSGGVGEVGAGGVGGAAVEPEGEELLVVTGGGRRKHDNVSYHSFGVLRVWLMCAVT